MNKQMIYEAESNDFFLKLLPHILCEYMYTQSKTICCFINHHGKVK